MPIVTSCAEPGCETLTMGTLCLEHELLLGEALRRARPEVDVQEPLALRLTLPAGLVVRTTSEPAAAAPLPR